MNILKISLIILFSSIFLSVSLKAQGRVVEGAISGAGGNILKGYILERGEKLLQHLETSENSKFFREQFQLDVSKLKVGLKEENIIIVSGNLIDRHSSEVDALFLNQKIYINETSVADYLFLGFNLDHLVFHELLRMAGYDDDGRKISKHLEYSEHFKPQSFLSYRSSLEGGVDNNAIHGSKNYKSISRSANGSVTILEPMYGDGNKISYDSSLTGICSHFGYGQPMGHTSKNLNHKEYLAVIAEGGLILEYKPDEHYFQTVTCSGSFPASENYSKLIDNRDGGFSIVEPKFELGGKEYPINKDSDLTGACKRFGFNFYIAHISEITRSESATLSDAGELIDLVDAPRPGRAPEYVLKQLVCLRSYYTRSI